MEEKRGGREKRGEEEGEEEGNLYLTIIVTYLKKTDIG